MEWLQVGHEVVIAGDINKGPGNNISGFTRISAKHDLLEIIQHFHGIEGELSTYARGHQRLDYIFVLTGQNKRA
jgi:endonuclease/exonuclease/phosphatase family metal-dependent hydrolase